MKNLLSSFSALLSRYKIQNANAQELQKALNPDAAITPELAYVVILVDLAMIDQNFDKREYDYIFTNIGKMFGLEHGQIIQMVQESVSLLAAYQSPQLFLDYVKQNLPIEKRQELLRLIRGLASADSVEDGFEQYLEERYQKILG